MKKALLALVMLIATAFPATTTAHAQTYTDLFNFDSAHGALPEFPDLLAQGRDGNLYGTTPDGGTPPMFNDGVVFTTTPNGVLTVLYNFEDSHRLGSRPFSGLTLGTDGSFYGTTLSGGVNRYGSIFRGAPGRKNTLLYVFTNGADGNSPYAPPVQGNDGNFYGTTYSGNIYQITAAGTFNALGQLSGVSYAPLLEAIDEDFYGTTYSGGDSNQGAVFRMTPKDSVTYVYSFDGTHGAGPFGGLTQGNDGYLYGTTDQGGDYNDGVVFRLTPQGAIFVVHTFGDPNYLNDGSFPSAGLVLASDGNFYGVTSEGGTNEGCPRGCGVIFQVTPTGDYSILYNFDGSDGADPMSTPMQHTNGKTYGMTYTGGFSGDGVVYSFDLGLPPFVKLVSPSGKIGQTGGILGQGFTGTTSVSLNGIPAAFTVVSDTYLTATVPAGATTGFVIVVTPSGTLTSNQNFQVRP
jgi:uncharacterized repeat protein (TIGR03803 family)